MSLSLLSTEIRYEQDVVLARQRAREIAALLGFDARDQSRIATAVSEIARNAFTYGGGGRVEFHVDPATPPRLEVRFTDRGPGIPNLKAILRGEYESQTGMGLGILGAKRLVDRFEIESDGRGTRVLLVKEMAPQAPALSPQTLAAAAAALAAAQPQNPFQELQQHNQELIHALDQLKERELELTNVNAELAETNRGVLALYSELDEKAAQLRRSSESKTRFLRHVSHEVRTPINAILSLSELLLQGGLSDEQAKTAAYIRRSAVQLAELVNDMLDLAKVEAGRVDVYPRAFHLNELLAALRGMFRPLATNEKVALIIEDARDVDELFTDDAKVSQILRNLVSNALKFTEQGEVRVWAEHRGEDVVIAVRDTGIGIAPGDQAHIFKEFSQVKNPLQNRVKGTGLGLAISKALAERLGGEISLESAPGVGSTFSVRLPMSYRGDQAQGETGEARLKALIVDDDEIARYLLRGMLPSGRFSIIEAKTGEEALHLARREHPRVMFLDLRMPGLSGFEVLDRLKSDPETAGIPVIINTMQSLSADESEQLSQRAVAVLSKTAQSRETSTATLLEALRRAGLD